MQNFPLIMTIAATLCGALYGDNITPEDADTRTKIKNFLRYALIWGAVVGTAVYLSQTIARTMA